MFLETAAAVRRWLVEAPSRGLARWAGRLGRPPAAAAMPRGSAARREPTWAGEGGLFLEPA